MRILHTGDLHLDSPFSGLDITRANSRRRELRETFSSMMRYAREKDMDMVIIAGDLFDSAFVTRETVALLVREFSSLSCPVIITPGNHDPYCEGSVWQKTDFSDNVCVFDTPGLTKLYFEDLGACVYGSAFTDVFKSGCPVSGTVEDGELINIIALHADTASPLSRYCHIPPAALRAFGADYAALGHIHSPEAANEVLDGIGAYCGCPEGRDFGECGPKGALDVTVEKGRCEINFVRFSKITYEVRSLNVDSADSSAFVESAVDEFIKSGGFDEGCLLRLVLTGCVSPSLVINTDILSQNARGLFYLEIEDSTSPTWNADGLLSDPGIRGELYRTLLPGLESADAEERERSALALRYALAALSGEDISDM